MHLESRRVFVPQVPHGLPASELRARLGRGSSDGLRRGRLHDARKTLSTSAPSTGLPGTEPTSYYVPDPLPGPVPPAPAPAAFLAGLSVSGTAIGNTFTHPPGPARDREIAYTKLWIDRAADMGAPTIRIFAGDAPEGHDRSAGAAVDHRRHPRVLRLRRPEGRHPGAREPRRHRQRPPRSCLRSSARSTRSGSASPGTAATSAAPIRTASSRRSRPTP